MNIVGGKLADGNLNDGETMIAKFDAKLSTGFYETIKSQVIPLERTQKGNQVGKSTVYI